MDSSLSEKPDETVLVVTAPQDSDGFSLEEEINIFAPGVRRAEILAEHLTDWERAFIFASLFLLAYVYGLDGSLRYVYQVGPNFNIAHISALCYGHC